MNIEQALEHDINELHGIFQADNVYDENVETQLQEYKKRFRAKYKSAFDELKQDNDDPNQNAE